MTIIYQTLITGFVLFAHLLSHRFSPHFFSYLFAFYNLLITTQSIFSIMLLRENNFTAPPRGQSVNSKKYYASDLRSMAPKFLKDIYVQPSTIKKNHQQSSIKVLTKENIKPEIISIEPPKQKQSINYTSGKRKQKKVSLDIVPRGLYNLGNSCYINATMQCLFHLSSISSAISSEFEKFSIEGRSNPPVTQQFNQVAQQMTNRGMPLNLWNFKKCIGSKNKIFLGNGQQDAQQFLTNLLTILNQELTRVIKKGSYKELTGDLNKKSITELSNQWWHYTKTIDDSVICDIFQGQSVSTVQCKKCSQKSINFDIFWMMPLTFHRNRTIAQLMRAQWQGQTLLQDYYCSKCKKQRVCAKNSTLFRLPKILVIQLKRFQFQYGLKRKRKEEIFLNLEIDVSKILNKEADRCQKTKYKLKSIVHHEGEVQYGHYYAEVFCESLNKWYELNDSNFDETKLYQASRSAYLLFYEQSN